MPRSTVQCQIIDRCVPVNRPGCMCRLKRACLGYRLILTRAHPHLRSSEVELHLSRRRAVEAPLMCGLTGSTGAGASRGTSVRSS